jgi:hypothetical protein
MEEDDTISTADRAMVIGLEEIIKNLEKIKEISRSTERTVMWIFVILLLPYLFGILWLFLSFGTPA